MQAGEVLCAFFDKRLKSCKWLFTPFLRHVTRVTPKEPKKICLTQPGAIDQEHKSYWEYRVQRLDEVEKIIHCYHNKVGKAFTEWFDSHDVIADVVPPDTVDPLDQTFVLHSVRSSLGAVRENKQSFFAKLFCLVLYHSGSVRTIYNMIIREMKKNQQLKKFVIMCVEHTFLGKYLHCRCRADFLSRRALRLQLAEHAQGLLDKLQQTTQRPMLLLCLKEYLFDKIATDADFVDIYRRYVENFDSQFKVLTGCTENVRITLFKKISEGHQLTHTLFSDSDFAFLEKMSKKFTPLRNTVRNRNKYEDSIIKNGNITREHQKCILAVGKQLRVTPELLVEHYGEETVKKALLDFEQAAGKSPPCALTLAWSKKVQKFTLPSCLAAKQIAAVEKHLGGDRTASQKTCIIFCPICIDVKNMSIFTDKEVYGYKNMKVYPMQKCAKCSFTVENVWCDGTTLSIPLIENGETFCVKVLNDTYLISPCCATIISIDDLDADAEGLCCRKCKNKTFATTNQKEKFTTEKCYVCTKIVRRFYKNKKEIFSSVGSKKLFLTTKSSEGEPAAYYFCKAHVRSWMHNEDTCPKCIEDVLHNIQTSSRMTKKRKRN